MNVTKYLLSSRVRTLFESHTSLWISSRGSEFHVIEWHGVQTCLPWTHISHFEEKKLGIRFKLIIFLMELKFDMSQSSMPDITRLKVQSNMNINFIIRRIDYIEIEKIITNKIFSNENTRLGDYKLIRFLDNPIVSSKKRRFAVRFLWSVGTYRTPWKVKNFPGRSSWDQCVRFSFSL